MNITILCSDKNHPVNLYIDNWIAHNSQKYHITLARNKKELSGGDILFLISCVEIIDAKERYLYKSTLTLHASDLPIGRGWSPHIWSIIDGAQEITLSLIEAEDVVDSGKIWHQTKINVPLHFLWNEINELLFSAEIDMLDFAVQNFSYVVPHEQDRAIQPTYHARRERENSLIDVEKSISSQFNLIRVCDPIRFPAYFELHGYKYKIILEKIDE